MTCWLDAQISPGLAGWINETFEEVQATPVRELGLRDAEDHRIYELAAEAGAIIITKDKDFVYMLDNKIPRP